MDSDRSKVVTWPHAEGIVRLTFSPDGQYLYTSGSEGYMRVFDASVDSAAPFEAKLIEYHDEPVTAIAASNSVLCSGSESGVVSLHSAAGAGVANEFESLVTRCSFPVRSVRFDPKGKRLAVASDELIVKIVDAKDPLKIQLLAGHKKGVREASWSPDGNLIATSCTDGTIMIWALNAGSEPTCVKTIDNLIRAAEPESEFTVEAVWHPSGKYFVVGSKNNEIAIISRDTWTKTGTFTASDGHTSEISALAFSANGQYLASAAKDGNLLIWSTATRSIVNRTSNSAPGGVITSLAFHPAPQANILAYADFAGQLVRWEGPVPANLPGPGLQPSRARSESVARSANGGDEYDQEFEGLDDFIEDDTGLGEYAELEERAVAKLGSRSNATASYVPPSKGQEPFQPGATPFRNGRRYLAFNMLGLIQVVERDDQNIVTIEFHDRSAHTGSHFTDSFKFSIAALGELGSVYGCKASSVNPSVVHYRPYDSWANIHEWDYNLPQGEQATALAIGGVALPDDADSVGIAGSGTVLVATSAGYVRFLTGSGIQKYLWNLGEEVVTMAAARDWALIAHKPTGGTTLSYSLIDTDTFEVVQQGIIPLVKGVTLAWVGFTDEHIPAMYDSNGVLSLLDRARRPRQARWVPALDSRQLARREGKQESYWPVGVSSQHAHVIILKGADKHPGFPTPLIQELDLQFPLLQLEVEQSQLEENYLRETFFGSYRRDGAPADDYVLKGQLGRQELETDKHLIKLIQTFCKAEKLEAALDAALLLSQAASLNAAGKLAAYYKLPALEERVQVVKEHKEAESEGLKREGKWSHLVDERTITAESNAPPAKLTAASWFNGANRRAESSAPPSSYAARLPPSSAVSYSTPAPPKQRRAPAQAEEDDDMEIEEPQQQEEEETYDEQEAQEADEESQAASEQEQEDEDTQDVDDMPPPPVVRKAINPFAKKAAAPVKPAAPAPNPYASKKATKTKDLSAKGSFFGRVEGTEPAKAKAAPKADKGKASANGKASSNATGVTSGSRDGTLQTFLFGKAPSATATTSPRKKRKSEAIEDLEEAVETMRNSKQQARGAKEPRELPREGEEFEETQETDTQTEESESSASLAAAKRAVSVVQEEDEEESEDTQMTSTQEATQEDSQQQLQKENSRPALNSTGSGDGMSKLAQFRNTAAQA